MVRSCDDLVSDVCGEKITSRMDLPLGDMVDETSIELGMMFFYSFPGSSFCIEITSLGSLSITSKSFM